MNIKFKGTEDQYALASAMSSRNKVEATNALEIFAALAGPIVSQVLDQADVTSSLYRTEVFSENEPREIDVDELAGKGQNFIRVWSQSIAGGLSTSLVPGGETITWSPYTLNSAVSWLKRLARSRRGLSIIERALKRMAQEILVYQNLNRINPILTAAAQASTNGVINVLAPTTASVFQINDLNNMMIRMRRLNGSWLNGGTPEISQGKLTDIFVSPEVAGQIRSMSYQGQNTRGVPNSDESTVLGLPDSTREKILAGGGLPELFNVTIHELNELGPVNGAWNVLFDAAYSGSSPTYDAATQDLVIGIDLTRDAFVRPVIAEEGAGAVRVFPDDQFVDRSKKVGVYSELEESSVVLDSRGIVALVV